MHTRVSSRGSGIAGWLSLNWWNVRERDKQQSKLRIICLSDSRSLLCLTATTTVTVTMIVRRTIIIIIIVIVQLLIACMSLNFAPLHRETIA